eukprot:TRINITY_DN3964_c0_g2_i1.p1 TRINITY_DN3964_c0_g2~~TRINITY_DN3964_c0_g2_i1.p1  ORF type:complete len:233 (+),score=42.61 TRINITY_DN3964_c0_g2_i1:111-809(+)
MFFFFFKQKTAYEMQRGLVGSEMCIRDRVSTQSTWGVIWERKMELNCTKRSGKKIEMEKIALGPLSILPLIGSHKITQAMNEKFFSKPQKEAVSPCIDFERSRSLPRMLPQKFQLSISNNLAEPNDNHKTPKKLPIRHFSKSKLTKGELKQDPRGNSNSDVSIFNSIPKRMSVQNLLLPNVSRLEPRRKSTPKRAEKFSSFLISSLIKIFSTKFQINLCFSPNIQFKIQHQR